MFQLYRQPAKTESFAPIRKYLQPAIQMAKVTEYRDNYTPIRIAKTRTNRIPDNLRKYITSEYNQINSFKTINLNH